MAGLLGFNVLGVKILSLSFYNPIAVPTGAEKAIVRGNLLFLFCFIPQKRQKERGSRLG